MAEEDLTLNIRIAGGKQAVDELTEILRLRNAVLGGGEGGGGGGGGGGRQAPIGGGRSANVGPTGFPSGGGLVDVSGRPITSRIDPGLRQAMRPVAESVVAQTQQAIVEEVRNVAQRQAQTRRATPPSLAERVRQQIASGQVPGLTPEVISRVTGGDAAPLTPELQRAQASLSRQRETAFRREAIEGARAVDAQQRAAQRVFEDRERAQQQAQERLERQRTAAFTGGEQARLRASQSLEGQRQTALERAATALEEQRETAFRREGAEEIRGQERAERIRAAAPGRLETQRQTTLERAAGRLAEQREAAFRREGTEETRALERAERERAGARPRLEAQRQTTLERAAVRLAEQRETTFRQEGQTVARQAQMRGQLASAIAEFEDPSLSVARRQLAGTRAARAAGRLGDFGQQADLQERLGTFRQAQRSDQLQEFFGEGRLARFNRAAFGPAIAGLSLQFGLLPAFQANQQVQQAGLQFGAFDPRRAGTQQAITVETTRLGQGALQAQAGIDQLTLSLLKLVNTVPGAGQALAVLGAAGGAATAAFNLAGPVVGAGAALATARSSGQAAQAARVAAGLQTATAAAGGAAVAGGGVGAVAAGLGLGALFLGGPLLRAAGLAPEAPEDQRTPFQRNVGQIPAQLGRLGRFIGESPTPLGFLLSRLREAAPAQQFVQGAQEVTREAPPAPLAPAAAVIRARLQAEATQTSGFTPTDLAARAEVQARLEARINLQQQRFGMDIARQQFQNQQVEFREDQAFAQRRLRTDLSRAGEDIAIGEGRAFRNLITSRTRRERDIGISEADQITDIRVGAIRQRDAIVVNERRRREDIGIGLSQNIEDINIGAGESREDVERGFGRGFRNLIFGQIGGLAGGVLGLMFGRQDALEDIETGRGRAISRAQRGAGRAGAAVGRETARAGEDVSTGERQAISDTRTGAQRQRAALDLSFADQIEDITTGVVDALDDAGKGFARASKDLNDVQAIQLTRQIRNVAIQEAVFAQQETLWQQQSQLLRDSNLAYEQLVKRLNDILVSLGGVPEKIDYHVSRRLALS